MFLHAIIPDWWCRHPALSTTLALRGPRPLRGLLPQREASEHVKELLQAEVQDEKEGEGGPDEVKRRKLGLDYDESDEEQEEDDSAEDTIKREVDIHNMF